MSDTRTRERAAPPLADPFRAADIEASGAGSDMLPALTPAGGGKRTDEALAAFVTAQRVAIKRALPAVLQEVKALGQAAGADFYYRIPFKDRKGGEEKTTWVEGPSIDCAMAVAAAYGNCWVGATVAQETHDAWIFSARFVDLEKGVTVVREFRQRKGQRTGMRDADRQTDILFQIGQSKAIRNVVCAAIPTVVNTAYSAAMDSVLSRVEKDPDRFREWTVRTIEGMGLSLKRIERALAASYTEWTNQQMARTYADLKAVKDGMVSADDLWPAAPGDEQTAAPQETTVKESAAAEAPTDAAEEGAEGSGQAAEEDGDRGARAPAEDPAERRNDPPPPAEDPPPAKAKEPEKPRPQRAERPAPAASAPPAGLKFD